MASFVVLAVANSAEPLGAEFALVGFLSSVAAHVNLQVSFFGKLLVTSWNFANERNVSKVYGLDVDVKARGSGKLLRAVRVVALVELLLLVLELVALEMLHHLIRLAAAGMLADELNLLHN